MTVVVNQCTKTLHKHAPGEDGLNTACGITYHLDHDHLLAIPFEQATSDGDASKCGRCFDDGGGY